MICVPGFWAGYRDHLENYRFDEAVKVVERLVTVMNLVIDVEAPFKKAKEGIDVSPLMYQLAEGLRHAALMFLPFIPNAAGKILLGFSPLASLCALCALVVKFCFWPFPYCTAPSVRPSNTGTTLSVTALT